MRLFALVLLVLSGTLPACGSEVATCASVCGPTGDESCVASCTATEDRCEVNDQQAAFQLYLTCVGNAGGLQQENVDTTNPSQPVHISDAVPPSCAAEAAALTSACGNTPLPSGPEDAGSSADAGVVVVLTDASISEASTRTVNDATTDASAACIADCDSTCVGDPECITDCEADCQTK